MWSRPSSLSDEQLAGFTFTHERSNTTMLRTVRGGIAAIWYWWIMRLQAMERLFWERSGFLRSNFIEDSYIHHDVRCVEPASLRLIVILIGPIQDPRSSQQSIYPSLCLFMSLIAIAGRGRRRFSLFVHR